MGTPLVVGRRGSHLQPAQHRDTYPDGAKNIGGDGGKVLTPNQFKDNTAIFFNASIYDLVAMIGGPNTVIVDRTHLTGRFNFTIRRLEIPRDLDGQTYPRPPALRPLGHQRTGLEFKRTKLPSQNLVIDHIERPSEN